MNEKNLEYLKAQVKFMGFGEVLNEQLENCLQEGMPGFQLMTSHHFGKDKMDAVLHFKKSGQDGSDMYFFNKYDATLIQAVQNLSQTFYVNNKGQSITFKEACNLLNGRYVQKELTPKEGLPYLAWIRLDFSQKDGNGNAKIHQFNENYGFDLKEALECIPLRELFFPDQLHLLLHSLEKGNPTQATLIKGNADQKVILEANAQFKTLDMYDMKGKKLFVPSAKQEIKYGQPPQDDKADTAAHTKQGKKKEMLPKNDKATVLADKKQTRKSKDPSIF